MKTSTRISVIFSVFTFFVILFFILLINIFFFLNWLKIEKKEIKNGEKLNSIEVRDFFHNQEESIEKELLILFLLSFMTYFLSNFLLSKLILKGIFEISDDIKNIDLENIKKLKITKKQDKEINIIKKSINNFLDIIKKNRENLKSFNSQVAHEFKTPLMIISSELEFLNLSGTQKESYKKIENQVEKLNNLLSNFLLLTKIDNTKNIKKEKINLQKLLDENLENLNKIYLEKNIKIKNNIFKKIEINTSKNLFEIIIKNLLDNAFKYNKIGGKIDISFSNNILIIKDSGIGIKEENFKKIWNNMFRENEFEKGYGIGLNLVKKICDVMGYKISVKSEEGNGTEFILKIK